MFLLDSIDGLKEELSVMKEEKAQLSGEVIASKLKGEKAVLEIQLRYEAEVSALKEEIAGLKALSVVHKAGKTESTPNVGAVNATTAKENCRSTRKKKENELVTRLFVCRLSMDC